MTGRIVALRGGRAPAATPAREGRVEGPPSELRGHPRGGPAGTAAPRPSPSSASRFRNLVLPHMDAAYSLARYLARDPVAAEDIAQDALLRAYRGFDGWRGGEAKPWLLAIVRNAYFDWRRRGRGWSEMAVSALDDEPAIDNLADPDAEGAETALIRQGDVATLRAAIEAIPEPFREALVLRDIEELSYKQVAEVTGAPLGTVMSRLARARRMLAEKLGVREAIG